VARVIRLVAALAAACVLTGTAAAADFRGQARALMPAPKEVGFTRLVAFRPAKNPAAKLGRGWKAGVAALFSKGAANASTNAAATVYVYANAGAAGAALASACAKCPAVRLQGIALRLRATTANGTVIETYTACRNVYVDAVTTGPETATQLSTDAGRIVLGVYRRAVHFGMTACG
jgi:hypothetical protein